MLYSLIKITISNRAVLDMARLMSHRSDRRSYGLHPSLGSYDTFNFIGV